MGEIKSTPRINNPIQDIGAQYAAALKETGLNEVLPSQLMKDLVAEEKKVVDNAIEKIDTAIRYAGDDGIRGFEQRDLMGFVGRKSWYDAMRAPHPIATAKLQSIDEAKSITIERVHAFSEILTKLDTDPLEASKHTDRPLFKFGPLVAGAVGGSCLLAIFTHPSQEVAKVLLSTAIVSGLCGAIVQKAKDKASDFDSVRNKMSKKFQNLLGEKYVEAYFNEKNE